MTLLMAGGGTAASDARIPDQPSRLEAALLQVASYSGAVDYSGLLQTREGTVAIFAYGVPERIDVWLYESGGWKKITMLDPGTGLIGKSDPRGEGFTVLPIPSLPVNITVPVPGNGASYSGVAVLSYARGAWRLVPFQAPGQQASLVPPGTAKVKGAHIESAVSDCNPNCAGGNPISTLWTYSTQQQAFAGLVHSPAATPPARAEEAIAYDPATSQLVMVGGYDRSNPDALYDTWLWDGDAWHEASAGQPVSNPNEPHAIGPNATGADLVYDARTRQMLLVEVTPNGSGNYSDTWTWDGSNWTRLTHASSPPQFDDALTYDPADGEVVLLVAGRPPSYAAPGAPSTETWLWNGSTWRQAHPAHNAPYAAGAPMAYDPRSGDVILQGSGGVTRNGFGPLSTDTWAWNGADWSRVTTHHPPPPSPNAVMAYDENDKHLWLLNTGGHIDSGCGVGLAPNVDQVYVWTGDDWSSRAAPRGLRSRQEAAMAYDPTTSQLVLFGGCTTEHGPSELTDETQIIDGPSQVTQSAGSGIGNKCDGPLDTGVAVSAESAWVHDTNERLKRAAANLHGSYGLRVPLGAVSLPLNLALSFEPHFDPGEAKLCAFGVTGLLRDPPWSEPTRDLSLALQGSNAGTLGPATYSADLASWTSAPQAPPDEPLTTTWLPKPQLAGGPMLTLSHDGPQVSVQLAELTLASETTKWTLLQKGNELLSAELGPRLALVVEIEKKQLLDELARKTAEANDGASPSADEVGTAEQEVAQEVADSTAADLQSLEAGYLGETVSSSAVQGDVQVVIEGLDKTVTDELAAEISNLRPGSADLAELDSQGLTAAELAPEDAALLDGTAGSDAVLGGGRLLCVMIAGGPEDIFGDIFCAVA